MQTIALQLGIFLYSGIPVVTLAGEWDEHTVSQLEAVFSALAERGQNEIILNLKALSLEAFRDERVVEFLLRQGRFLKQRFGRLDVVGLRGCPIRSGAMSGLRWAKSEEEALCQIKGVSQVVDGRRLSVRLLEVGAGFSD